MESLRPTSMTERIARTGEARAATVAVVRSENRRGAVAEALSLIDADICSRIPAHPLVTVTLGRGRRDSTTPDALSALVDVLLARGASDVEVTAEGPDIAGRARRLGFLGECWGRPVSFAERRTTSSDELVVMDAPMIRVRHRDREGDVLAVIEARGVGRRRSRAVAVAGVDPFAVAAVGTRLRGAGDEAIDEAGPDRIEVVGDAVLRSQRRPGRRLRRDEGGRGVR